MFLKVKVLKYSNHYRNCDSLNVFNTISLTENLEKLPPPVSTTRLLKRILSENLFAFLIRGQIFPSVALLCTPRLKPYML